MFGNILSGILGGLGGAVGSSSVAPMFAQVAQSGGFNPFSGISKPASDVIGGSASKAGTLLSLPSETLTSMTNLGKSNSLLGGVTDFTGPIGQLDMKSLSNLGLGGLSNLNPFASGQDANAMSALFHALAPVGIMAGLSSLAAENNRRQYGDAALP